MHNIEAQGYNLEIGPLATSSFENMLAKFADEKIVIIVDDNTNEHCLEYLLTSYSALSESEIIMLPVGEENKQMSIAVHVWEALTDYGVGRYDLLINLGGGVITDMGGFIASCYKRGCSFINIPTSLLGMVDASIGGKTGLNLGIYKNQIGVFSNPLALYIDSTFLETLPDKEWLSGYAELIKHGIIADSQLYYDVLDQMEDPFNIDDELLVRCIQVKNTIVQKDPLERGERKKLNFGHTFGHVIEGYFLTQANLSHGHCVAIGMVMEVYLSHKKGLISKDSYLEFEMQILRYYEMPKISNDDIQIMIGMLWNDKKNRNGRILCCLLDKIGSCSYDHEITEDEVLDTFMHFENKQINMN